MRNALFFGLVIVLNATPAAAQSFPGTNLDPFSPPYPLPPYYHTGIRFVSVTFETSPDVVRALVPVPIDPMQPARIKVLVADYSYYTEALLEIPVSFQSADGYYYPILYLDDVISIIVGREIWGISKVDADIDIDWLPGGESVVATVSRFGTTLITIDADFGPPSPISPSEAIVQLYNLKLIPSVEAGGAPEVCHLNRMQINVNPYNVRTGTGTLVFGSSSTDPLADIPIYGIVNVETYYQHFNLPFGEVVWDYLAQPGGCTAGFTTAIFRDSFESGDTTEWSAAVP